MKIKVRDTSLSLTPKQSNEKMLVHENVTTTTPKQSHQKILVRERSFLAKQKPQGVILFADQDTVVHKSSTANAVAVKADTDTVVHKCSIRKSVLLKSNTKTTVYKATIFEAVDEISATTRRSSGFDGIPGPISVKTTTGYLMVEWWNGDKTSYGTGAPATAISPVHTITNTDNAAAGGSFADKRYRLYSVNSSGGKSGKITSWVSNTNAWVGTIDFQKCSAIKTITMTQSSTPTVPLCAKIDVSGLKSLTSLSISQHKALTELNVGGCTALTALTCSNAILTTLNVSSCTALMTLNCYSNLLTTLNVSSCTALTTLNCYSNLLTTLNVSSCTALTSLNCASNLLTTLNVSSCTALSEFLCYTNKLTALVVSGLTALTSFYCFGNLFTTLNASNLPVLQFLDVSESFDPNTTLTSLNCSNSPLLTSLRIANCSALTTLNCTNTGLDEFDGDSLANFDLWDRTDIAIYPVVAILTVTGSPVADNSSGLASLCGVNNWNLIL